MSKGTLLLADDSITIQKVVNLTFADEGIDVVAVGDGDTAAARLADVKPDIVLADVNMPGLTGYQICEMIRNNEATKDLPVVLLVGSFEPFDEAEANRVGASSYMTKPFQSIRQLVSHVTDLMEGKSGEPEVVMPVAAASPAATVAESESAPAASDIESLYQSSFEAENEPVDLHHEASREIVDVGMDDEMILTTYTDAGVSESGSGMQEESEPFVLETGDESTAPAVDTKPESDTGFSFVESPAEEAVEFDQFSETVPIETEVVHAAREPETFSSEEGVGEVFEVPEVAKPAAENGAVQNAVAAAFNAGRDFDEVDLLEIPGLESGRSVEFTTEQTAAVSDNPTQVVSLSPELMEIIVQKVVEKLSEKY